MNKTVILTEAMTGRFVPDPLRHAFDLKTSAHSRGAGMPLPPMLWQETWNRLMSTPFANTASEKRAAYFHIPFCRTKCSYCGFFQNTTKDELVETYVDYLIRDIEMTAQLPNVQSAPIHAVYFGGGTPTDLTAEQIRRLGDAIKRHLPLANDCEMTFESRFSGLTDEKIDACIDAGFNRFSLGVQTFNTTIRRKMSRIDDEAVIHERLQKLMGTGQIAVVIDLIFGLPYQTMEDWLLDLDKLIASGIDGADLYQLILMGGTRLAQSIEEGKTPEPATTAEKATMFKAAIEHLEKHNYRRLSVSHWGYTTRERNIYNHLSKSGYDVIPFGCGAGGMIDGHSMMLNRKLDDYYAAIDAGEKPMMGIVAPSSLYKAFGQAGAAFDLGWFDLKKMDAAGFDFSRQCKPLFDEWVKNGLAERDGHFLNLTLAGQFWAVNMNQGLQAYLLELTDETSLSGTHMGGHNRSADELEKLMAKMPKSMLDKMPKGHGAGAALEDIPSGCPVHKLINWIRK